TLHQNAIRRAGEFLQTLSADDNVALIDARDIPRSVIESPLRDLKTVEDQLRQLPPPGGSCAMLSAVEKAIGILGRSSAAAREVVVLTDRQANGWRTDKDAEWTRIDDLLKFPTVRPRIWSIDVAPQLSGIMSNVSVGRIQLSREMTVPDFPLRLRAPVRNDSDREVQVPVRLMLDGQLLAGESQNHTIPPRAEIMLEFDHAIRAEGTHILSVATEPADDAISVDNVSHAAVQVTTSLPVLLVNGTPSATASARDTFFADLAFAPLDGKPPWVTTRVVQSGELRPSDFDGMAAAMLCNVGALSPESAVALAEFVGKGNGLLIACGPNTTPELFKANFSDTGILPTIGIERIREAPPQSETLITVQPSIQAGWMERFQADETRSFLKASFRNWHAVRVGTASGQSAANVSNPDSSETKTQVEADPKAADIAKSTPDRSMQAAVRPSVSQPIVLSRLTSGDPLLIESRYGDGFVLLMASTIDRQWSDLPIRSDFVPFMYESIFHIASNRQRRNVSFGEPLIAAARLPREPAPEIAAPPQDPAKIATEFLFTTPSGSVIPVMGTIDKATTAAVFTETCTTGPFRTLAKMGDRELASDAFVVNYDHTENTMSLISVDDKAKLATNDRVRFSATLNELREQMFGAESITELWAALMTIFVLFLIFELLLTRRAIRRGYGGDAI
ncbi:MAG: hypothetical protein ACK58L_12795, partial [Planctomycetota bacterium]